MCLFSNNDGKHFCKGITYIFILFLVIVGLWPFNFRQLNKAGYSANGLHVTSPTTIYTKIPPKKLLDVKEFTILINLTSDFSGASGYARIFSYSLDSEDQNFMVGQWKDSLIFKLKGSITKRGIHFETDHVLKKGEKSWIAIVFDGKTLSLCQDGEIKKEMRTGPLDFSKWNNTYPLVIGSEANGKFPWSGSIYSITVFDQAFSPEEIKNLPTHIEDFLASKGELSKPLIHYSFDGSQNETVMDRGKGQPANLTTPQYFNPYKRIILEKPYTQLHDYRRNTRDMIINIIGFIPLGFLLSVCFFQKGLSFRNSLLLSIVIGFCLSLIIEIVQAFLPTRSSNMNDLIANTLGTAIGSFFPKLKSI